MCIRDALPIELRPPWSLRAVRPGPARGTGGVYSIRGWGSARLAADNVGRGGRSPAAGVRPGVAPGPPRRTPSHRCRADRSRGSVSYTHLRAHETPEHLVCRLLLEKKKKT